MADLTGAVTHPRFQPRRGGTAGTWWSKAFLRAVEESAFSTAELKRGRTHARAGDVGAITVSAGAYAAAVTDGDDACTVTGSVPVLPDHDASALIELIAAEAGRIAALLAGDLPHGFVEAVEEAGIELLPYGGELGSACTCQSWLDPCPHALAVLTQLAWLVQRDPFVLFQLRGLSRDQVLAGLHELNRHARTDQLGDPADDPADDPAGDPADDLAIAEEAALRAARELAVLQASE